MTEAIRVIVVSAGGSRLEVQAVALRVIVVSAGASRVERCP